MALALLTEAIFEFRRFVRRYEKIFRHKAQRQHFETYLRGLIGPLERKSIEPIALDQGVPWYQLEDFISRGQWDAEDLLAEHVRHVRESLGSRRGIIIIDPTSFPKKGSASVGVARQWCGQLGKEENCVVGVNLAYASEKGHTLLSRRLYLPRDWAEDHQRRRRARVPTEVVFRTSGELAYELIASARRSALLHAWITGDEEFGKLPWLQDWLHADGERYILEVPTTTRVWVALPRRRRMGPISHLRRLRVRGPGRPRLAQVKDLNRELPDRVWSLHDVRAGSKGPIRVYAALVRVTLNRHKPGDRRENWLLITQTLDQKAQTKYFLSNADANATTEELLAAGFARWPVEQCFGQGKNETGLGDYETRSWPGWHRHTALSFLAHHWLILERNRLGGKIPRDDRGGNTPRLLRRVANGQRRTEEAVANDAAPTETKSHSAHLALEEGSR